MPDSVIPADLHDFVIRHIDSIAQIEALLLLRRQADQTWDVPTTATRLYVSEQETLQILSNLCDDGLIACSGGLYRYACASPENEAMVKRLEQAYANNLIALTNIIHSKPRRIREFANAFKLRKDRG